MHTVSTSMLINKAALMSLPKIFTLCTHLLCFNKNLTKVEVTLKKNGELILSGTIIAIMQVTIGGICRITKKLQKTSTVKRSMPGSSSPLQQMLC